MTYSGFEADELLDRGIELLRAGNPLGALASFEKAFGLEKSPAIKSYLGLCIATERGSVSEAVTLCREAIEQDPYKTVHYLNLGKVYLKAGRKTECLDVLRKGLSFGDDSDISELLGRIGTRNLPVFSCLPRGHFLNRYLGLILRWLRLR